MFGGGASLKTMAITVVALLIGGCTPHGGSKDSPDTVHLVAVVKAIEPLGRTAPEAIVVSVDPLFALHLDVISVSARAGDLAPAVVFAIHSPVKLFAADTVDVIGHRYAFAFSRLEKNAHLEVIRRLE